MEVGSLAGMACHAFYWLGKWEVLTLTPGEGTPTERRAELRNEKGA